MVRSKSFDTLEVREIGRKEAGESRGFLILWIGIMEDVFQIEGKECKDQERLKICRKNPCQSEEGALAWDRQLFWASGSGQGEVGGSRKKFSGGEGRVKARVRLLRARGSAELKKVASGPATLGQRDRKVGSQVIGEDRSRLPGRGTVGEVRREGR